MLLVAYGFGKQRKVHDASLTPCAFKMATFNSNPIKGMILKAFFLEYPYPFYGELVF